jgi:hypothetical protein
MKRKIFFSEAKSFNFDFEPLNYQIAWQSTLRKEERMVKLF